MSVTINGRQAIYFDTSNYFRTISAYQPWLIKINKVIELYNLLPLGKAMTTDILRSAIHDPASLRKEYLDFIDNEIVRQQIRVQSQINAYKDGANDDLRLIEQAIRSVIDHQERLTSTVYSNYLLSIDYVDIVDGEAVLTEESKQRINHVYCIFLDNEDEKRIWSRFQSVKDSWDELVFDIKSVGYPLDNFNNTLFGERDFIYEGDDNSLVINAANFQAIKTAIAKSKKLIKK